MAKKKELTMEEKLAAALVREDEQPYEVPGNWVWVRLDKLKENESGFFDGDWILSQNMDINGEVRLIQLSDIGIGSFLDKSSKHINSEKFDELGCKELIEGDILISRMAEPIVRSFIFPKLTYKCITVVDVAVLRCNNNLVNRKFANYLFNTPWFTELAMSIARGTTRVRITRKNLGESPIPLPPLAEQQRIVDRIESLFDQLDQAKALIQEALDSFATRKAAILHQAFTGTLTKKWREEHGVGLESWEEKSIGELFKVFSGKGFKEKEYSDKGIKLLRISNVSYNSLDWKDTKFLPMNYSETETSLMLHKNDIVIALNRPITNNQLKISLIDDSTYILYQRVGCLRLLSTSCLNKYFLYYFLSKEFRIKIENNLQGSDQPYINLPPLKKLTCPVCTYLEQQEIVRILDVLFEKEQAAQDLCDQIDQIDTIKKTILGKAFRGKLGTNVAGEASVNIQEL